MLRGESVGVSVTPAIGKLLTPAALPVVEVAAVGTTAAPWISGEIALCRGAHTVAPARSREAVGALRSTVEGESVAFVGENVEIEPLGGLLPLFAPPPSRV